MPTAQPTNSPKPQYDSDSASDSDEEGSQISVTEVSLGLPDGQLEKEDESNPLVSRIGGRVAWLPLSSPPPKSISICSHCSKPMQLLVQIFAPLIDSAFDRTLLVWGCSRRVCQRKGDGSIRAIRVLQHNPRWASKLQKQKARREAREIREKQMLEEKKSREELEKKKKVESGNPFSMSGNGANTGGLGSSLFGSSGNGKAASNPFAKEEKKVEEKKEVLMEEDEESSDEESSRQVEESKIKETLTTTTSSWSKDSKWFETSTHYNPSYYLNTIPEPSKALRLAEKQGGIEEDLRKKVEGLNVGVDRETKEGKEKYEQTQIPGLDSIFEKFLKRVGVEGRQVVRYEFDGIPLPFSGKGEVFDKLWPKGKGNVQIGRNGSNSINGNLRNFNDEKIPKCENCGGKRVFECQLMPNLVNLLKVENIQLGEDEEIEDKVGAQVDPIASPEPQEEKSKATTTLSKEEIRRKEIEGLLGRQFSNKPVFDSDGISRSKPQVSDSLSPVTGLTWSTALVFVCEKDCCKDLKDEKRGQLAEGWREEWVGLMWED